MTEKKTIALVTGASSGLGAEFCRQLADVCDVVIGVARRLERLEALADELSSATELHCVQADLCTVEGLTQTMETLRQKGPVDYLVNNAGFSTAGHFADLPIGGQRDMLLLHAEASMTLCRAAIPFMRERGGGSIINVSSLASLLPYPGFAMYSASKAFLNYLSLSLQEEERENGIRVQALCPGFTHTEFHDQLAQWGFDKHQLDDRFWMSAQEVVAISLAALSQEQVLVFPGECNKDRAKSALQAQLDALEH
ncbi:MAG: SDR family NAD(P)-dependent oxidoreductase [Pseudomonadota bacterium]